MKFLNLAKIKRWILVHKKTFALFALILIFIGYKIVGSLTGSEGEVDYITAVADRGAIVSSITGTGQVSASNRVDVSSEVSGDIVSVPVKLGDTVREGQILASIDSRDATRSVQNAEISLENAKISYEKAQKNASDQSVDSSLSDINGAYEDGYTALANMMIDLPDIIEDLDNIYYNRTNSPYFDDMQIRSYGGDTALGYKYKFGVLFDQTKNEYEDLFKTYRSVNPSDRTQLTKLIENSHALMKKIHSVLTGTYNTIDYIKNRTPANEIPSEISSDKSTISSDLNVTNSRVTALSNTLTDIEDAKDSSTEATLDLKTAQLNLSTAEDNLRKAKEDLANHSIRAPFSGVIGKVDVEYGDRVSSNGAVATIITDEKIAEISLNEVDISKVKTSQKATLTFDAIDDLTITGTVTEIDLLGTVSQGVVNYTVKISFDVNDDRVKTGMSLSAAIVSDTKQNVVRVPNSAVKSQAGTSYIETLNSNGSVTQIPIEMGLSNDDYTEIISGLNEGDSFISRTVTQSSTPANTAAPSLFGGGGTNRGASAGTGGNVRFQTR